MAHPHNIIFSYPGEYAQFIEHCAKVIEQYLGPEKVFHYTDGQRHSDGDKFFLVLDEWLAAEEQPIQMVCLCHEAPSVKARRSSHGLEIVNAQKMEMVRWAEIKLDRRYNQGILDYTIVKVPKINVAIPAPRQFCALPARLVQNERLYKEVTDIDRASAERLAEHLLRKALGLPPKKPSSKAFTYERKIIEFYRDLYRETRNCSFLDLTRPKISEKPACQSAGATRWVFGTNLRPFLEDSPRV